MTIAAQSRFNVHEEVNQSAGFRIIVVMAMTRLADPGLNPTAAAQWLTHIDLDLKLDLLDPDRKQT